LAQQFGTSYQQFAVAYQLAWTIFWWHEDFSAYLSLYERDARKGLLFDSFHYEHMLIMEIEMISIWKRGNNAAFKEGPFCLITGFCESRMTTNV
jgi:hypothetical protein